MAVIPGVYQLLIHTRRPKTIWVGALGQVGLVAGWYVYTGSARNGLEQRVRRHLRHRKRRHWHIDYLLVVADRVEAFVLPNTDLSECELHARMRGRVLVPGFGSSDCGCESHLAYFARRPRIALIGWNHLVQDCLRY